MKCLSCTFGDTRVIESRTVNEGEATRRRRECPECKERFTTYERVEVPQIAVVKHDGTREIFSRDKLIGGLMRACEKTTVTPMDIDKIVTDIEKALISKGDAEVSTSDIGQMIIERLAKLNEVAYVRFASVYRRFKTLAEFETELKVLRDQN